MDLKNRISDIIKYSGLTAGEFADEIDVPRSSISHISAGRNKPSLDFLVKVKDRFPELEWDWLISGAGAMIKEKEAEQEVQASSVALPDLFALIDDENFGKTESEDRISRKSPQATVSVSMPEKSLPANSQQLEKIAHNTEEAPPKIKRMVIFYDNGRFESFEP